MQIMQAVYSMWYVTYKYILDRSVHLLLKHAIMPSQAKWKVIKSAKYL